MRDRWIYKNDCANPPDNPFLKHCPLSDRIVCVKIYPRSVDSQTRGHWVSLCVLIGGRKICCKSSYNALVHWCINGE